MNFFKKTYCGNLLFSLFLLLSTLSYAQVPPPAVQAKSWLLVDTLSKQTLASSNADQRVEPASLTKLMTTFLVFDALKTKKISLEQMVVPSDNILRVKRDESRSFIEVNKPVSVQNLLHGMVTQSGNDATIALAELVGGSEAGFVKMMNDAAQKLEMNHTHYADVNGMPDPNHYTTANDMAKLAEHLINDYPEYFPIFSEKHFTYNKIKQPNRNRLLWIDSTVDGLKTGHTAAAGYCLIATAKRPIAINNESERRLISIVMGEPSDAARTQDSLKLLNYGYQAYGVLKLYEKDKPIETIKIYKGKYSNLEVGFLNDQYVSAPREKLESLKTVFVSKQPLQAPIKQGETIGVVKVLMNDQSYNEFPVVALKTVEEGNFFKRLIDSIVLLFSRSK